MPGEGVGPISESFSGAMGRRLHHLAAHPIAWLRYVWLREIRRREVIFNDNPRFSDWRPMYGVCKPALVRLTGAPPERLDGYFSELPAIHRDFVREAGALPSAGALIQAPLLYLLTREMRPARVIETGISSGYSARLILEAIARNGTGHLDSIGVDSIAVREEARSQLGQRPIGWLVPERLRPYWSLHRGKSEQHLPLLLDAAPDGIDVFLHDSLHDYATMHWEYRTAWPHLRPRGLLASHDVHANSAWTDFLREQHLAGDEQLDHDLGVVRVPSRT
jgi:predicted O-methyltransferase YrrM